jgi:septal ring factor EnvC (AmiA/AmiB activator)
VDFTESVPYDPRMPKPVDLTVQVLKEIRDEVKKTNARLDQTNARLDQTNARLDQTNEEVHAMKEELSRRIVESELRTATAITELAGTVRDLTSRGEVREGHRRPSTSRRVETLLHRRRLTAVRRAVPRSLRRARWRARPSDPEAVRRRACSPGDPPAR